MWKYWIFGWLVILTSMIGCTQQQNNSSSQKTELSENDQFLLHQWNTELKRLSQEVNLLEDDLSKSIFLRNYCSGIADYGQPSQASNKYFDQQSWDSLSMAHVYDVFIKDSMPGTCGPLSSFYCTLLSYFNIPCVIYNHGLDIPGLSHVLALVEINNSDTIKVIVQDPHYAMMYVDEMGVPLDFFNLLELVHTKSYNEIYTKKDTIPTHIIFNKETVDLIYKGMKSDSCRNILKDIINQNPNADTYLISANRTYEHLMNNPCSSYKELIKSGLEDKGYPSNILHTFLLNGNAIGTTGTPKDLMIKVNSSLIR